MLKVKYLLNKRKYRVRAKLKKILPNRLRLSIFRSNNHIYAQIIDDINSITLVSASTLEKEFVTNKSRLTKATAYKIGQLVASRAMKKGITSVMFDRGGYLYHGRLKSLAEAARETGLKF